MSHGVGIEKKQNGEEGSGGSRSPPPPPDGGWGWVVVFASFMIHIITDGMTYSFGIFYLEFLEYFQEGKGYTAWIVSILAGVTLCSGPISSVFVNWYGCRIVTICGSILASACVIISVFAPSVLMLFFTIGVGTGLGFGLIYLPAIVSVTVYFEKYRSLATGIAVCGSGVGTFLFAPLTRKLISEYGWRGAMLIIGGIILNCVIFGLLFRPLEQDIPDDFLEPPTEMTILQPRMSEFNNAQHHDSIVKTNGNSMHRSHSSDHMQPNPVIKVYKQNGQQVSNGALLQHISNGAPSNSETARLALSQPMLNQSVEQNRNYRSQSLKRVGSGVMNRPDVFYQGSFLHLASHRAGSVTPEEQILMGHHGSRRSSIRSLGPPPTGLPTTKDFKDTISALIDFSLLSDPIFIIFTVSNFLTSIGFYIPYVYIVAQAEKSGITKENASYLLSIIGIANSIGRIVLGYISDKPWVNRLIVYNSCLTICGVSTILSVFCKDFYSMAVYSTVFGFTIGAYVGLTSVILVDLLGLHKLTDAFGLLLLFQGFASIVGSPIAGALYDAVQSYNPGFYVSGITITLSGIILFTIPPIKRYQARKAHIPPPELQAL